MNVKKSRIISIFLTLSIIFLFILPGNLAVVLTTTPKYIDGKSYFLNTEELIFEAVLDIEANENIPVEKLGFVIYDSELNVVKNCTFSVGGTEVAGCSNMGITSNSPKLNYSSSIGPFGYGYNVAGSYLNQSYTVGYGYANYVGYAYYGAGYGYGYGLTELLKEFNYTIAWNASDDNENTGTFTAKLMAFVSDGSNSFVYSQSAASQFRIVTPTTEEESTGGYGTNSGGGAAPKEIIELNLEGQVVSINKGGSKYFNLGGEEHKITIQEVGFDYAVIVISSTPKTITLKIGESRNVDVDDDGILDITVFLKSIVGINVDLIMSQYEVEDSTVPAPVVPQKPIEKITGDVTEPVEDSESVELKPTDKKPSILSKIIIWFLVLLVIVGLIVGGWVLRGPPKEITPDTPIYYRKIERAPEKPAEEGPGEEGKAKKNIGQN